MKNQTLQLAVLTTSLAVFSVMAASYYVGPGGRDDQVGSIEAPFATLERAREAVRAAKTDGVAGPHDVVLLPGRYPLSASFKLGAADAGTASAPVVYRAAEAGTARLLGSTAIPAAAFGPVTDAAVLALLEPCSDGEGAGGRPGGAGFPGAERDYWRVPVAARRSCRSCSAMRNACSWRAGPTRIGPRSRQSLMVALCRERARLRRASIPAASSNTKRTGRRAGVWKRGIWLRGYGVLTGPRASLRRPCSTARRSALA